MHRRNLGKHFSEGARLAWLALVERGWSLADLTKQSGQDGSAVHRVLYGDRKASLGIVLAIEKTLGVAPEAWTVPATQDFVLPVVEEEQRATGTEGN